MVPLDAELSLLDNNDTQSENAESLSGLSVLITEKTISTSKLITGVPCNIPLFIIILDSEHGDEAVDVCVFCF